jgi:hypothetical protein
MVDLAPNCYTNRMGTSRGIDICLDLENLLKKVDSIDDLTKPFSEEEMGLVITKIPNDKAHGQMGLMV